MEAGGETLQIGLWCRQARAEPIARDLLQRQAFAAWRGSTRNRETRSCFSIPAGPSRYPPGGRERDRL